MPPPDLPERLAAALSGVLPPAQDAAPLMSPEERQAARPAAVLVALVASPAGLQILLTRRTEHLPNHAGQISFAGGRVDASDRDTVATALREAEEEIGLDARAARVLGVLPEFLVPSGFRITPVLAWLEREPRLQADPSEVAEIFYLPAAIGLDPEAWYQKEVERAGRRRAVWAMDYQERHIWGATAAILVWLGSRLRVAGIRL